MQKLQNEQAEKDQMRSTFLKASQEMTSFKSSLNFRLKMANSRVQQLFSQRTDIAQDLVSTYTSEIENLRK
jgi:predicted  nucleic acid-binding Zn-ribbon protein